MRYNLIENGKRTRFIYHNGELLYEKGEENKQSKEETSYQLGAGIEALQRNQKMYYYHQDEQLNTALITNGNGEIKNQYQYDAFGNGLEAIEEFPNRIRYTGQQYDQQTEQYYLRARYYNPILGRFMQEDVYQGDGLNLYAYCQNNPIMYYDPSGYDCGELGKTNEGLAENKSPYDPDMVIALYESQNLRYRVFVPKDLKDKYKTKKEYQDAYSDKPSIILRQQLIACGVQAPAFPNEAHHIVPINQAHDAIDHLAKLGIDGNSAANGVFLPQFAINGNPQVVHSQKSSGMRKHGTKYVEEITKDIMKTKTREEALGVINDYRRRLLNGSIDFLYKSSKDYK